MNEIYSMILHNSKKYERMLRVVTTNKQNNKNQWKIFKKIYQIFRLSNAIEPWFMYEKLSIKAAQQKIITETESKSR